MGEEKKNNIQLILNINNRLEKLKSVFDILHSNNIGKYGKDKSYFSIKSKTLLTNPNTVEGHTFNILQQEAYSKGIENNCFCLNISI